MIKRLLCIVILSSFFLTAFSQSMPLPSDNPISIAAPHLPLMIRYDGTGKVFYAENTTYKSELNQSNLKDWIKNYPDEVSRYKIAIGTYLKTADTGGLTTENKEIYRDLKSQYVMVIQF